MDLLAAGADEEKREAARAIAALADGKRAVLAASGVIRPLAEVLVDAIEKVKVSRKSEWRLDKTWCPTQGPNLVLIDAALGALFLLADEEDRRREMAAAGVIPSLGQLFQYLKVVATVHDLISVGQTPRSFEEVTSASTQVKEAMRKLVALLGLFMEGGSTARLAAQALREVLPNETLRPRVHFADTI